MRLVQRAVFAATLGALIAGAPSGVAAQDREWNRYTLEDLGGVFIRFEVDDVCTASGLSATDFEAETSLKLIEAEVGVLTELEMLEHPAMPELRISFDCAETSGGNIAWVVGLRVQQAAQMLRDTQITLPEAVTWYQTTVGASAAANVSGAIESSLMAGLDGFAEAWAAANGGDEGGS